tara:strand:- start:3630 stop:4100 length:471 start_codon:yes stop_codon:yes gene_type:complete
MIIECINCNKKFEVNSELIPSIGRTIQCGSCNHTWFYKPKDSLKIRKEIKKDIISENKKVSKKVQFKESSENLANKIDKIIHTKDKALIKYQKKNKFSLSKFLSYIIVIIISFIGLILLLDTFKFQLFNIIPGLEFVLFSLFETLKDVQLFIKDLI